MSFYVLHVALLNGVLLLACGIIERIFTLNMWHYRMVFISIASLRHVWYFKMTLFAVTIAISLLNDLKFLYLLLLLPFTKFFLKQAVMSSMQSQ